jgi:hypothetical protein
MARKGVTILWRRRVAPGSMGVTLRRFMIACRGARFPTAI